ncbi:MAG: cohesin domain-containing protein [Halobacteriota archaeon]|nr:cohesin domain-containing protein [Halobacteriota archaeon]
MLRKVFTAILAIALLLLAPGALATDCSVAVGQYEIQVGELILVPVEINSGTNIGSVDLTVTFNPTLLSLENINDGEFDNTVVNLEDSDSGVVKVIAFQGISPGLNDNITIVELELNVLKEGECALGLEIITLKDASNGSNPVNHTVSDGNIKITKAESGDDPNDPPTSPGPIGGGVGGGGGFIPSEIDTDSKGRVQVAYSGESSDGKAKLTIPEGTIALDEDGKPLKSISIISTTIGGTIFSCNLGPNGATFDPGITIQITFDPGDIAKGEVVVIKVYDGTEWVILETIVDMTTNTATAKASRFSIFALFDEPRPDTTIYTHSFTATATPEPTEDAQIPEVSQPPVVEASTIPWVWLMLTMLAIGLIVVWVAFNER